MKTLLFDMTFDDQDEKDNEMGVYIISLVDKPAIISQYMAFSQEAHEFKFIETDKERRIVTGPVMIPDMPIRRIDDKGEVTGVKGSEFFVKASAEIVEKSVWRFMKQGRRDANLMHQSNVLPEDVFLFETWYTDKQRGILKPRDYKECPDKTWFASYKIDNDEVYNEFIKTGMLRGFSLEGNFRLKPLPAQDNAILSGLERILGNRNK